MTRGGRFSRRLGASFLIWALALLWVVSLGSTTALAACQGTIVHDAVGGNEATVGATRIGDRADVLVNNFTQSQHANWRAVALIQNGNNFLEAGWVLDVIFGNQGQHPYKTWVNLGVAHETDFLGVTFAGGTTHEFKVHDQNTDQSWSFAWDGTAMGNETMSMTQGLPVSEAESNCTDDPLKANFTNLNKINCQNCSWVAYLNVERYINTTTNWKFCRRSNTRYEVLQTC
jgi:hypothetical protein